MENRGFELGIFASGDATGRGPLRLAWIAAIIFLSAWAGLALSDHMGRISAIWVANAILVFFLLESPRRAWPAILAAGLGGNLFADLYAGDDILTALTLTSCNAAGVMVIAGPMQWFGLHRNFSKPQSMLVFYALAIGPAPLSAAVMAAAYFHTLGRDFLDSTLNWYATDALGYGIVVPILMTVPLESLRRIFGRDLILGTLTVVGVVLLTIVVCYWGGLYGWSLAFLFFPAVLLATFKRGFAGGAIGVLMTGGYLMMRVLTGGAHGPVPFQTEHGQIITIQLFIAVMGFSVILTGAALAERRRLEEGLAAAIVRAEASREEALVARDAADKASRAKSMFLATMSHELRTPLNAIIGFSELTHGEAFGPVGNERYREYADLILRAGRHLLSLINDVLDMSKIEAGKYDLQHQSLDICGVIRECRELMADRARERAVMLIEEVPAQCLWADADHRALKQILLNLVSNAIKFTPRDGKVTIGARYEGDTFVLWVRDTGVGIPPDQLSRLGNPFVQIRNNAGASHEGTGLGLALVRALAELHRGSFRIESTLGRGTTASVVMPIAQHGLDTAQAV